MQSEYFALIIVTFIKLLSLLLITLNNKYGLPLFFSGLGLSSTSFGYSNKYYGMGTENTIEWIAELVFLTVLLLVLLPKQKTKIFNVKQNYIFFFFLLILFVYLVSIRSFDLYMLSVLMNALYPIVFYLFINHYLTESNITQIELSRFILVSVGVSLFVSLILFLLGNEIYYVEFMDGFTRFRFFGSLGPMPYSYYLMPFALYFIVIKKWKLFLVVFLLIVLAGTRLNSAILFAIATIYYLNSKNLFNKKIVLWTSAVTAILIIILTVVHFKYYDGGRTIFWQVAVNEAFKNGWTFLFGNGTGFSKYINYEVYPAYGFPSIHNQFLKISVDTGVLLGVLVFLIYPLFAFSKLLETNNTFHIFRMFCMVSLISIIVGSMVGDTFDPGMYKSYLSISLLIHNFKQ